MTKNHATAVVIGAAFLAFLPAYLEGFTIWGPSDAPTLLFGDRVVGNHAAYELHLPYTKIRISSTGKPQRGRPPRRDH
ncbi:MAG: hypothetical protein ABJF23_24540 [Bryobacteraceae bacterium]